MTASTLRAETDKQIFVSYSRADRDHVATLYADLERLGFLLWRDLHEIAGGEDWWQNITDAIDASETMVLCISPASLKSEIVTKEWLYARQVGTRVIPVIVDDIDFDTLPRWMQFTDMKDFRDGKPERDLIWRRFIHDLNTPYTPQKVSFMVEAPPFDYIPRPDVVEPIIASLQDPANRLIALKGAGGYGKTTLARVVCHDQRVRTTYFHGTLWVTLGETVSEEMRIQLLLDLVVELRGERPPVQTLEAARNELRTAIGDRYVLLVVDDAWRRPDLESFLVDAPNAAVLVTTRIRPALPDKTPDEIRIHDIDAMQPDQAVRLLAFELPEDDVARQHAKLDSLAKRLGEWPLMIKLTNGALKSIVEPGGTLEEALQYVEEGLSEEGLPEAFADDEKGRNATATASLTVSLKLLEDSELTLYRRLAIFPEDVDIPLTVLETLWDLNGYKTINLVKRFFNISLLLRFDFGTKTVRLHDIVRSYLRHTEKELLATYNSDFLTRMQQRYSITHWRDLPLDAPYLWDHLAYHLIDAGQTAALRDLLFDFGWMYARLNATDPAALLADAALATSVLKDDRELRLIESALRLAQNALSEDKKQLANQIRGRLWIYKDKPDEYPTIVSLWHAVPDIPGTLALLPTQQFPPMDQAGGALLRTLEGHTGGINGAIQLKDGRILSWSHNFDFHDSPLHLWKEDGTLLAILEGHTDYIHCAMVVTNERILSWSLDNTLRLWEADGTSLIILEGHSNSVNGAFQLPDGRILSWSDDHTLQLWTSEGTPLITFEGHTGSVIGAEVISKGHILSWSGDSFGSYDNTLRLWSLDGITIATFKGHTREIIGAMVLSDSRILSWSYDHTLRLWSLDGITIATFKGHTREIIGAMVLSDGHILSWSGDNTLRLWAADSGSLLATFTGHTSDVSGAAELRDGRILSWSKDNTLRLWATNGAALIILEGHTGGVRGAAELRDGRILSWSEDSTLRLWATNGAVLIILEGHTGGISGAAELRDGRILSWSEDSTLRLWKLDSTSLKIPQGHTRQVNSVVALNGGRVLSWSGDNTLRLWSSNGTLLATLEGHTDHINGAIALNDGRILSWSANTLRLWSSNGTLLATLEGHISRVDGALQLTDSRILSWSDGYWYSPHPQDNTLQLWAADGTLLAVLEANYYDSDDEAKILNWARENGLDINDIFSEDPETDTGNIKQRGQQLQIYHPTTRQTLASFIGDTNFEKGLIGSPVSFLDTQTIAAGDAAGRVIFLKVVPPTD